MGLAKNMFIGSTGVLSLVLWSHKDMVLENILMSKAWDENTLASMEPTLEELEYEPEPDFPPVETNRLTRQQWGYGSVVKDILGNAPRQYDETPVTYESRLPVHMDDPKFDIVGQLTSQFLYTDENNIQQMKSFNCSSTIARDVDGYDNALDSDLMFTAGHCVNDKVIDGVQYTYVDSQYITNYVDIYGYNQVFTSDLVPNSMVLQYDENSDIAVAILEKSLPIGMQTAFIEVDSSFEEGQIVSVPGYSGDKQGLYNDDCRIVSADYNWNINTCDILFGASGSPQDLNKSSDHVVFGAITSAFFPEGHPHAGLTLHSNITTEFLDNIPYLQRVHNNAVALAHLETSDASCLLVTASRLNIRFGPGTEFNDAARKLEKNTVVYELGRVSDWSIITLDNGDTGFIARTYNGNTLASPTHCPL